MAFNRVSQVPDTSGGRPDPGSILIVIRECHQTSQSLRYDTSEVCLAGTNTDVSLECLIRIKRNLIDDRDDLY